LTSEAPLEAFVCFSSLAGLVGAGAAYAAANTFLDAWASSPAAKGRALSVAWGPWAGAGMATSAGAGLERLGVRSLPAADALDALGLALGAHRALVVAADVDWRRLAESLDARGQRPLLGELVRPSVADSPALEELPAWRGLLDNPLSSARERAQVVRDIVLASVARIMGSNGSVPEDVPLNDLGFDSLMSVELRRALFRETGVELPVSLSVRRPSVAAVVEYVTASLGQRRRGNGASSVAQGECIQALPAPSARLFCFHEAAGSSIAFAPFVRLSTLVGVEVHTIAHRREKGPSDEAARTYLSEATAYIRSLSDLPFVLFGQSIGALHGWAVANSLAASGAPLPRWHVVSSSLSPRTLADMLATTGLDELAQRVLHGSSGPSKQQLEDFRADLSLWQHMGPLAMRSLAVPIAAYVGHRDHLLDPSDLERWRAHTSAEFTLEGIEGDHFYLRDPAAIEQLTRALASLFGKVSDR
jgi:surfactin synthase thioesterase subunit